MVSEFGRYEPTFGDRVLDVTGAAFPYWIALFALAALCGPVAVGSAIFLLILGIALGAKQ